MEGYDFIAVDFETATRNYNSACAIGIATVEKGEIKDKIYSLIKPSELRFDPNNIAIHGITPEMVKDSPTLSELWPIIGPAFETNLVIAHNAHFDMSVLSRSLDGWSRPDFKYVDSVALAKDFVPGSKSLENCAEHFGINMGEHHNALDDAVTCAKIVLACLTQSGLPNIGSLCFALPNVKIHQFSELNVGESYYVKDKQIGSKAKAPHPPFATGYHAYTNAKDITPSSAVKDETNPFYQKSVVFTGTPSIGRREAMQLAADAGAVLKDSISSKVDFLVVGEKDPAFVDEAGLSGKEVKAMKLNQSGKANIAILTDTEFMNLLGIGGELVETGINV